MAKLVDDPQALPKWRFVFVCKSQRCLDARLAELKQLEKKFPQYQYNYKWQQVGNDYVIRLINIATRPK
ncbi:MAG TPA: hypothetical protein VEG65_01020 [Candidatus Bathyarchaeia archaeon]|nr:hypothetical protein [Candidatus Bathyarchaeia archaeon]